MEGASEQQFCRSRRRIEWLDLYVLFVVKGKQKRDRAFSYTAGGDDL